MTVYSFVLENREWLFSGAGIASLAAIFALLKGRRKKPEQINVNFSINENKKDSSPSMEENEKPISTPTYWQGIMPDKSKYVIVQGVSDSFSVMPQVFSFEYSPRGHAKPLRLGRFHVAMDIQFTCQLTNIMKALSTGEYSLNILQPYFLNESRRVMEKYSIAQIRNNRDEISKEILSNAQANFDELGFKLLSVTIGSIDKIKQVR